MTTSTEAMNGEQSPEQIKAAQTLANRQAGAAKAREKKLASKSSLSENEKPMWGRVFLTLMQNYNVKSLTGAETVVALTDDVIDMLKEKGKL